MQPEERLAQLGLSLPEVPSPVASYVNCVRSGHLLYLSGGLPITNERTYLGKVPQEISIAEAQEAARIVTLNRLAVLHRELGSLDLVERIIQIQGYVNATDNFTEHPQVINGASDLLVEIFGERGKHSRLALGVPSLPLGVCVEISMTVSIKPKTAR